LKSPTVTEVGARPTMLSQALGVSGKQSPIEGDPFTRYISTRPVSLLRAAIPPPTDVDAILPVDTAVRFPTVLAPALSRTGVDRGWYMISRPSRPPTTSTLSPSAPTTPPHMDRGDVRPSVTMASGAFLAIMPLPPLKTLTVPASPFRTARSPVPSPSRSPMNSPHGPA